MTTARTVPGPAGGIVLWEWPGDGAATLLFHGLGNSGRYWDAFAAAVAGRLRLAAPDARGHGDSAKPAGGFGMDDFVGDALAALDAMGEPAVVVGHSLGGRQALALAAAHPDRVRALALVDMSLAPNALGERARRLLRERPETFADAEEALAYLRRTSPGYAEDVYRHRLDTLLRRGERGYAWRSSRHALERILAGAHDADAIWRALASLPMPTLVVRGIRSPAIPEDARPRLIAALRRGRLLELDTGHNVALERPRELADAVVALAGGAG